MTSRSDGAGLDLARSANFRDKIIAGKGGRDR